MAPLPMVQVDGRTWRLDRWISSQIVAVYQLDVNGQIAYLEARVATLTDAISTLTAFLVANCGLSLEQAAQMVGRQDAEMRLA